MMVPLRYLEKIRGVLNHLEQTQLPAIQQAAELIVGSLTHKGVVYCAEIGHGIQSDFIYRAGGIAAIQLFSFKVDISDKVPACYQNRSRPDSFKRDLETVRFAVQASNLRAGDVMMVSSVSGRNRGPIELTLACRAKGVHVIGFTAMEYTRTLSSLHPSGKRLFEVVDVMIDIGAPAGDAAVDIPGYDIPLMPVSGVAMDVAGWMILGRVMEKMAARGQPVSVFTSVNREGGDVYNRKQTEQFESRGF